MILIIWYVYSYRIAVYEEKEMLLKKPNKMK